MKIVKNMALAILAVAALAACQTKIDIRQTLSKADTRKEIMDSIANDSIMSREMMEILLNSKYSNLMQMENHAAMMRMMKQNHKIARDMMSDIMKTAEGDTSMMNDMCNSMMGNQPMKAMMAKKMDQKHMKKMGEADLDLK